MGKNSGVTNGKELKRPRARNRLVDTSARFVLNITASTHPSRSSRAEAAPRWVKVRSSKHWQKKSHGRLNCALAGLLRSKLPHHPARLERRLFDRHMLRILLHSGLQAEHRWSTLRQSCQSEESGYRTESEEASKTAERFAWQSRRAALKVMYIGRRRRFYILAVPIFL